MGLSSFPDRVSRFYLLWRYQPGQVEVVVDWISPFTCLEEIQIEIDGYACDVQYIGRCIDIIMDWCEEQHQTFEIVYLRTD